MTLKMKSFWTGHSNLGVSSVKIHLQYDEIPTVLFNETNFNDFKVQIKETKIGTQFLSVKKLEGKRAPDNKIFELH